MIWHFWRRAGPWLLPVLIVVEAALVFCGWLALGTAVIVGLVVEALLWAAAVRGVIVAVRRFRAGRAAGQPGWRAAEDGLAQVIPRPVAKAVLFEPRLWICLVRWVTGRHPGNSRDGFGYEANLRSLIWVAAGLVIIEGTAVDIVLAFALPGSVWVWICFGVHAYALLFVFGLLASWSTRPHLIDQQGLRVRDGIFTEIVIPYTAITAARTATLSNFGRSGLKIDNSSGAALLALGDANVCLTLDPWQTIEVDEQSRTAPATLAITVDEPQGFLRRLRQRVPHLSR